MYDFVYMRNLMEANLTFEVQSSSLTNAHHVVHNYFLAELRQQTQTCNGFAFSYPSEPCFHLKNKKLPEATINDILTAHTAS